MDRVRNLRDISHAVKGVGQILQLRRTIGFFWGGGATCNIKRGRGKVLCLNYGVFIVRPLRQYLAPSICCN